MGRRDDRGHRRARAGPGGVGRLHENPWAEVSFPVSRPRGEHPPGVAARIPRRAGRAGDAGVRRQGDRLHRAPRRRGNRHRADPGPAAGSGLRRRRRSPPARADQGRRTTAAGGRFGSAGHPRRDLDRTKGDPGMTSDDGRRPIRRALISVYDKTGLAELARGLHEAGVDIVSTGSTAKTIAGTGVPVTPVEEVAGFPEVLDGRVKTLHPNVHAGLLADQRKPEHVSALANLGIAAFELVVVNLYPFTETGDSGASIDECVEQIDIGGPSMVRAAAKNHPSVAVVVDPFGYDGVLAAVRAGGFTLDERKKLASLAFRHTAEYDVAVASWMGSVLAPEDGQQPSPASGRYPLPAWLGATWRRAAVLRYGENPHQQAALYRNDTVWPGLAQAEQLHGKEMSYNNYTDADAAWRAAFDHEEICVAIIKHANPRGIAIP